MSKWQVEIPFEECAERLEWQLRHLQARDKEWRTAKQAQRVAQDRQSRAERAFCFIYTAGTLEDLFRKLDSELIADLRRVEVWRRDLRPTSLTMLMPGVWESVSTDRVLRLVKRAGVVQAANEFYVDDSPLDFEGLTTMGVSDGRTVNTQHFEAIWNGLCLSEPSDDFWPSRTHRQAVATLADKRNRIAHFEADPREEAFRSSYGDLATMVQRVSESVDRLGERLLIWLDRFERGSEKAVMDDGAE